MTTIVFQMYNWISAIFILFSMISFSIGFSPFTENIFNKSWTRNKNTKTRSSIKYLTTISLLLLLQLMMFCLIVFVLFKQHTAVDILITEI